MKQKLLNISYVLVIWFAAILLVVLDNIITNL
jgi:hypothetical protein